MRRFDMCRHIVVIVAIFVIGLFFADQCFARAGKSSGSSSRSSIGNRGSKTNVPPKQAPQQRPAQQQVQKPVQPPVQQPIMQPAPARSGFWRSMAGGMIGGMLGGMLFHSFGYGGGAPAGYGGTAYAGSSGIGLLDIIILAIIGYIIYRIVKSRRGESSYNADYADGGYAQSYQTGQPPQELPYPQTELEAGLEDIRRTDRYFDEDRFKDIVSDIFYKVQAAWSRRDLNAVRNLMASEIFGDLNADVSKMKVEGRINKLENIGVRSVKLSEAWQENGKDFITVEIAASMLDYTTDEAGKVLDGDDNSPVGFLEYWTFVRDTGSSNWQLTSIQQPQ